MKKLKIGATVFYTVQGDSTLLKYFAFGTVVKIHENGTADVKHAGNGTVSTLPISELKTR